MPLPNLNHEGELPEGIHPATIDEVVAQQAATEFGASVFWIRPSLLFLEPLDEFIAGWQVKRDGTRRGIIEVSA